MPVVAAAIAGLAAPAEARRIQDAVAEGLRSIDQGHARTDATTPRGREAIAATSSSGVVQMVKPGRSRHRAQTRRGRVRTPTRQLPADARARPRRAPPFSTG